MSQNQPYNPRSALIAMKDKDEQLAYFIEHQLRAAGIGEVYHKSSDAEAYSFLNTRPGPIDLLFTGEGMDSVADYVESRPISWGTYTIAVSTNGVRADFKFHENRNLEAMMKSDPQFFLRLYQRDQDAQKARAEENSF